MNVFRHDMEVTDKAVPLLWLGHIMAFTNYLNAIGAPFERHLERNLLPVTCHDPDCYVPVIRAWAFFESITKIEDPMLAWLVANSAEKHNLSTDLLQKMDTSPSLYRALHTLLAVIKSEATALQMGVVERHDDILIFTRYPGISNEPGYHQAITGQFYVAILVASLVGVRLAEREW